MEVYFTAHAKLRCKEDGVEEEYVANAIQFEPKFKMPRTITTLEGHEIVFATEWSPCGTYRRYEVITFVHRKKIEITKLIGDLLKPTRDTNGKAIHYGWE